MDNELPAELISGNVHAMSPNSAQAGTGEQGRPRETGASLRVGLGAWWVPGLVWVAGIGAGVQWAYANFSRAAEIPRSRGFDNFVWTVQNARFDLWHGGLAHMYAGNGSILVALPGLPLLIVTLIRGMSLVGIAAPSQGLVWLHGGRIAANYLMGGSWWVLYGFASAAAFSALFPLDALARRCGIAGLRRWILVVTLGLGIWWMPVLWAHPEDGLAVALLAWGSLRALDHRWPSAGWLLGLGVAVQTPVLLGAPVMFAMAGVRRWTRLAVRVAVPGLLAVAIPLIGDPSDTIRQVVKQPTYPLNVNARVTPGLAMVPHPRVGVVDAGWPRSLAVVLACLLAASAVRWWGRSGALTPPVLVWTLGVSLSLRRVFESVVFPYYLVPPVAFLLVAALARDWWRTAGAVAIGTGLFLLIRPRLGEWAFWGLMVLGLAALAWLGFPGHRTDGKAPPESSGSERGRVAESLPGVR
jgi:hypothetical protein